MGEFGLPITVSDNFPDGSDKTLFYDLFKCGRANLSGVPYMSREMWVRIELTVSGPLGQFRVVRINFGLISTPTNKNL